MNTLPVAIWQTQVSAKFLRSRDVPNLAYHHTLPRCTKLALPPYSNKMSKAFCTILYQDVPNSAYHIILTVLTILNPDVLNLLFHITPYHTVVKGPKLYNHTKMYNHTEHTAMWQTWSKLHSLTFPDGLFSSCGAFRSNFRGEEMSTTPAEQPHQRG